jgi:hypothetical protein
MIEWNGQKFYLFDGYYMRRDGARLHRLVWAESNGPIPEGAHIHHRDGDRRNNDLSNLEMLDAITHREVHTLPKAIAWHRSSEGREWHRKTAIRQWENPRLTVITCRGCGKAFKSAMGDASYCGRACSLRSRRQSGHYAEERICVMCGAGFTVEYRYRLTKTCSRSCSQIMRWGHRRDLTDPKTNPSPPRSKL